jgi:drug/metabolite transporter (DMT)-like permease
MEEKTAQRVVRAMGGAHMALGVLLIVCGVVFLPMTKVTVVDCNTYPCPQPPPESFVLQGSLVLSLGVLFVLSGVDLMRFIPRALPFSIATWSLASIGTLWYVLERHKSWSPIHPIAFLFLGISLCGVSFFACNKDLKALLRKNASRSRRRS